jgi:hypothetical protein
VEREAWVLGERGDVGSLTGRVVVVVEIVEPGDGIAAVQEGLGYVTTDKAGCAGN